MHDLTTDRDHCLQPPAADSPGAVDQVRGLADAALLLRLRDLVRRSAELTAAVLIHLGEVDARGLHLGEGYSSLFAYCTGALGLSEAATYKRIQAARVCRRLPSVLEAVACGRIHLSGVCILAPYLDEGNADQALADAGGRPKREIERLAERLRPVPVTPSAPATREPAPGQVGLDLFDAAAVSDPPSPSPIAVAVPPTAGRPATAAPPSPAPAPRMSTERRVSLVATPKLEGLLDRARALLAHAEDGGSATAVVERALELLVTTLEKKRFGVGARPRRTEPSSTVPKEPPPESDRPRAGARTAVPAAVRRAVYERDGGRCTFVGSSGHRCDETHGLQIHHRDPWATGGPDTRGNLTLHCRAHNALLARRDFGDDVINARIRARNMDKHVT